jgi:hypothetical protein
MPWKVLRREIDAAGGVLLGVEHGEQVTCAFSWPRRQPMP